jgi:hypothetical protein
VGVKRVDNEMRCDKRCLSFIIFILSSLLLSSCVSAQCGDCDDRNPCTRDLCDGMICQHTPQSCDDTNSTPFGKGSGADINTAERIVSSSQEQQDSSALKEAINIPASCDDNNPCTVDSSNENGCVHDPVNCDDGNASTTDLCSPSGCVNTPLPGESSNVYSAEFMSPVPPELPNTNANENTTINESENEIVEAIKQPIAPPICDDGNPCTTDAYNETGCVYTLMNCDDGNDSTLDSCQEGTCINEPTDRTGIISENNSTKISSEEALMAHHPSRCDDHDPCTEDTLNGSTCEHKPKNCDDGNSSTKDYCFEGKCYHTTLNCDDGNNCTIDSFDGNRCVHTPKNCDDRNACTIDTCVDGKCVHTPRNCNDGNPCTRDYCDRVRGCMHSPVDCGPGKTCIDGVCRYLYYPYAEPYYPYNPYISPATTLPPAQSYTIPAGTVITLPWARQVTAFNMLKVENGIAYPGAPPVRFLRPLGLEDQTVSGYQTGLSISERAEMIGISWKEASFTLVLIQPDGSILPVQGDNRNILHLVGLNYDYYFLRNPAKGNWGIEVKPKNPGANGVGFSLITGLVKGAAPINQP